MHRGRRNLSNPSPYQYTEAPPQPGIQDTHLTVSGCLIGTVDGLATCFPAFGVYNDASHHLVQATSNCNLHGTKSSTHTHLTPLHAAWLCQQIFSALEGGYSNQNVLYAIVILQEGLQPEEAESKLVRLKNCFQTTKTF